eukprot:2818885-Prymnesium_polylepis.1
MWWMRVARAVRAPAAPPRSRARGQIPRPGTRRRPSRRRESRRRAPAARARARARVRVVRVCDEVEGVGVR